jgi:hypothetical protein
VVALTQRQTFGFAKTGDGFASAPGGTANVTIQSSNRLKLAATAVTLRGAATVDVSADDKLSHRAGVITLS